MYKGILSIIYVKYYKKMAAINRHFNRQSAIDTHTNLLELLKATVSSQYDGLRLAIEQNDQQKKT